MAKKAIVANRSQPGAYITQQARPNDKPKAKMTNKR